MRIAIIADSHYDERSRFEECVRVHDWIASDIDRRGDIDLVLHAGDVYEARSTPTERRAVAAWVQRVANIAPVVIVRGNHDAVGDLPLLARLRTRHPVVVEERAAVHTVHTKLGPVDVCCLAWPQTSQLAAHMPGLAPAEALRAVLRGFRQTSVRPRVLLAHAMVSGSRTSHGQPLVGCDLEIGLDDLALADADLVALGHIHMPQSWDVPVIEDEREEHQLRTIDVVYPGSPRRTAFGEVEEKGYVIAEISRGGVEGWTVWERTATPCAPMHLMSARWNPAGFWEDTEGTLTTSGDESPVRGAEIRFRYVVNSDHRDAARERANLMRDEMLADGALVVKVEEEVIGTGTARAPEIASAPDVGSKLRALWKARADEPEGARADRLVSLATSLEAA